MHNKALLHRLGEIATLPVEQRVARAVLRLAQPHEPAGPRDLQMSRPDLTEYTGKTLYTVSRVISNWTRRKLVRAGRMRLVVTDSVRLAAIATREPASYLGLPPQGSLRPRNDDRDLHW